MEARSERTTQIRGANGSVALMQLIAEDFMQRHPDLGAVLVSGGGNYRGFKAVIDGTSSLGMVATGIPAELERMATDRGVKLAAPRHYGLTAVVVMTHPDNPLRDLDIDRLRDVFSGRVKRWEDVGGPSMPIEVCCPSPRASETELWRAKVMGSYASISATAQVFPTGTQVIDEIVRNRQAIGFASLEKIGRQSVNILSIGGVEAGAEQVRGGVYPLIQRIGVVHLEQLSTRHKAFVDFLFHTATLERFQPHTRMWLGGNAIASVT